MPIIFGGGHENERRAGTENVPGIIGFVEALERFVPRPVFDPNLLGPLTDRLLLLVKRLDRVHFVGSPSHRLANTLAFVVEGSDSIALLAGLDLEGICASSGSACSAGSLTPSHVILALGLDPKLAKAYYDLGIMYSQERKNPEARSAFEKVLAARPGSVDALRGLAALSLEEGDYDQAFKLHQKLIETGERTAEVFYNCGLICQKRSGFFW